MRLTAAKQLGKGGLEILVDFLEPLLENLRHLASQIPNQLVQLGAGLLHVLHLLGKKFVPLRHGLVLLNGIQIHTAQAFQLAF